MNPLFSIITVCRNAADTIAPTVASVDAQTCRLYEHIVVDGAAPSSGSTAIRRRCAVC